MLKPAGDFGLITASAPELPLVAVAESAEAKALGFGVALSSGASSGGNRTEPIEPEPEPEPELEVLSRTRGDGAEYTGCNGGREAKVLGEGIAGVALPVGAGDIRAEVRWRPRKLGEAKLPEMAGVAVLRSG